MLKAIFISQLKFPALKNKYLNVYYRRVKFLKDKIFNLQKMDVIYQDYFLRVANGIQN